MNLSEEQLADLIKDAFNHWHKNHAMKFLDKSYFSISDIETSMKASVLHYVAKHSGDQK